MRRELGPEVQHGVWIRYADLEINGGAAVSCEVDILLIRPDSAVIVECKLSQRQASCWDKLRGLYGPLVAHLTGRPVTLVQAFKNINTPDRDKLRVVNAQQLLTLPPGSEALWHVL